MNIAECLRLKRRRLFSILLVGLRQTPLEGNTLKKVLRFFYVRISTPIIDALTE